MKRLNLISRRWLTATAAIVFVLGVALFLRLPATAWAQQDQQHAGSQHADAQHADAQHGDAQHGDHATQQTRTSVPATRIIPAAADASYYAYVACESEDEIALVRLTAPAHGSPALEVVKRIPIGIYDLEIEGPHGLCVSPDGKFWFVSIAHGRPNGILYKYSTGDDKLVGEVELGLFPATMQISTVTGLMHIVNFNLHGGHVPSTVSIVEPNEMVELTRVPTGIMPHGSRFSVDGAKHYSLTMMSDELFEIDAQDLVVSRVLNVQTGEGKMMTAMPATQGQHGATHGNSGHGDATHGGVTHGGGGKSDAQHGGGQQTDAHKTDGGQHGGTQHGDDQHGNVQRGNAQHAAGQHGDMQQGDKQHGAMDHMAVAKPTWVQMHPSKPLAYVACNGSDEVVELNLDEWKITRRFKTGKAPYNVEVTPDGTKFVVTYKGAASTGIWDLETGKELARVENSRKVPHGIAITPDSRFALVSVEGIGGEPGGVDAIDLTTLQRVGVADVGKQAGGIAFWKMEAGQ